MSPNLGNYINDIYYHQGGSLEATGAALREREKAREKSASGLAPRRFREIRRVPLLPVPSPFLIPCLFHFSPRQPAQSRRSPAEEAPPPRVKILRSLSDIGTISRPRRISASLVSRVRRLHMSNVSMSLRVLPAVAVNPPNRPEAFVHFPATSIEAFSFLALFLSSLFLSLSISPCMCAYAHTTQTYFQSLPAKLMVMTWNATTRITTAVSLCDSDKEVTELPFHSQRVAWRMLPSARAKLDQAFTIGSPRHRRIKWNRPAECLRVFHAARRCLRQFPLPPNLSERSPRTIATEPRTFAIRITEDPEHPRRPPSLRRAEPTRVSSSSVLASRPSRAQVHSFYRGGPFACARVGKQSFSRCSLWFSSCSFSLFLFLANLSRLPR